MKNRKVPTAKLALGASLIVLLALGGCADRFIRVSVPFPQENPLPFKEYSRIILGEFTESVEPDGYSPDIHVQDFFVEDVATLVEKPVEHMPGLKADSPGLTSLGPALLIVGSLKTVFNKRNIIDEARSRYGDRIRTFKDVQNWRMALNVLFIDAETGNQVAEFSTERQLKEVENTDMRFNYRKLFNQVTDRFVGRLTARERRQDRFLLVE